MPEGRKITLRAQLLEGHGDFTVSPEGALQLLGDSVPEPLMGTYLVSSARGDETRRMPPVGLGLLPYAASGERVTVRASLTEASRGGLTAERAVDQVRLMSVGEDHRTLGEARDARVNLYVGGALVFTTDAASVGTTVREDAVTVNLTHASEAPPPTLDAQGLTEAWQLRESAEVAGVNRVLTHTPTGTPLTLVSPGLWSALGWPGPVPSDDLTLTLENVGNGRVGLDLAYLHTPYVDVACRTTYTGTTGGGRELSWVGGSWTVEGLKPGFRMKSLRWQGFTGKRLEIDEFGLQRWRVSDEMGHGLHLTAYGPGGVVLASGPHAITGIEDAVSYSLTLDISAEWPIEITSLTLLAEAAPRVALPDGTPDPNNPNPGAVFGPLPTPAESMPSWADFRGAVPPGTRRIMRHPLMPPGVRVDSDAGAVYWESRQFLQLPEGARCVFWARGPEGDVQPRATSAEYTSATALTWGQLEIRGYHDAPGEAFGNVGTVNMRTYTPQVEVLIDGIDASLDLVQAGGLSASFLGDFAALTGGAGLNGGDMVITLDGVGAEWGKIVSYRASNNEDGVSVEIAAVDPLDYHNVDVDAVFVHDDPTNARTDLAGYALDLAGRVDLPVSGALGEGALSFPNTRDDTLDTEDEVYSKYGHTITQELELVANTVASTVVSDPHSQTIRFLDLLALPQWASPPRPDTCAFISQGYDLSEGYGAVEISGVSNTVSVLPAQTVVPFVQANVGGIKEDTGVVIPWMTGQGQTWTHAPENRSGWFPGPPNNATDGNVIDYRGEQYVEFQSRDAATNRVTIFPIPVSFNGGDENTPSEIGIFEPGAPQVAGETQPNGFPVSFGECTVYGFVNGEDFQGLGIDTRGPETYRVGDVVKGWYNITDMRFRVETPAQIRARLGLSEEDVPDAYGKCVTGFRCYLSDEGLYGYYVYFRLAFTAKTFKGGQISVLPFICPPLESWVPVGSLPLKKVTVNNPFIVQERPKGLQPGMYPDLTGSEAYARGVTAASALTRWEAMKRHAGSVKVLGGRMGRPGDVIEGQVIIANPTVEIAPGEACWTTFKTSSLFLNTGSVDA